MEQVIKKALLQKIDLEINRDESGFVVINGEKHDVSGRVAGIILDLLAEVEQLNEQLSFMHVGHGEA